MERALLRFRNRETVLIGTRWADNSFERWMNILLAVLFMLPVIVGLHSPTYAADSGRMQKKIKIYFFWGDGCPHCENEKRFLETVQKQYPAIAIESYEVWKNQANALFFTKMTQSSGIKATGVPVTFIGRKVFVGFSEKDSVGMEDVIKSCLEKGCIDPADRLSGSAVREPELPDTIDLPFFGAADPHTVSLPLITLVLGGLDSFNPCAFFVLFFLLSLLVHARSRTRMLMIGGIFVLFSGAVYFIFMAAWLNIFMLAGNLPVITVSAGLVGLIVAGINIKDFFFFKKGISLSIPEKAKPKLFERMRNLLRSTSLISMMFGTMVLALAANTYELLCTAGFPMVYARILTLHNLPPLTYYLYLMLYNTVYVIPLGIIVIAFTVTLGARKLTEWQGRKLKLISGIMMLSLSITLVADPALLNNIAAAVGMLVITLAVSALIISLVRRSSFVKGDA